MYNGVADACCTRCAGRRGVRRRLWFAVRFDYRPVFRAGIKPQTVGISVAGPVAGPVAIPIGLTGERRRTRSDLHDLVGNAAACAGELDRDVGHVG